MIKYWPCLFVLVICAVVFFLYSQGLVESKKIKAILYVFRPEKDADRVTLDSCTGWVKHAGRFCESRSYEFTLECQLSSGDVDVILLDKEKQLLKLNQQTPIGKAELDSHSRYYLRWEFRNATGKCELRW